MKFFEHKTMDHRVHRVSPYRRKKQPQATLYDLVRQWWGWRVTANAQLTSLDCCKPMFDYRGEKPWFRYVATIAMYNDFITSQILPRHIMEKINLFLYVRAMRRVVPGLEVVSKFARLERDGQTFLRPRRAFFKFEPREFYLMREGRK